MSIKPIGERVLIEPAKLQEITSGGIYIPEAAKESKKEGTVLAVGKTKDGSPLPLNVGDKILYGGYTSDEFEVQGKKYVMIDFKDVLAVIE
jgi:chaperonin GroES